MNGKTVAKFADIENEKLNDRIHYLKVIMTLGNMLGIIVSFSQCGYSDRSRTLFLFFLIAQKLDTGI